ARAGAAAALVGVADGATRTLRVHRAALAGVAAVADRRRVRALHVARALHALRELGVADRRPVLAGRVVARGALDALSGDVAVHVRRHLAGRVRGVAGRAGRVAVDRVGARLAHLADADRRRRHGAVRQPARDVGVETLDALAGAGVAHRARAAIVLHRAGDAGVGHARRRRRR